MMKLPSEVYILLRNHRRADQNIFKNKDEALLSADRLSESLSRWEPSHRNKITVVKTKEPFKFL